MHREHATSCLEMLQQVGEACCEECGLRKGLGFTRYAFEGMPRDATTGWGTILPGVQANKGLSTHMSCIDACGGLPRDAATS